MGNKEFRNKWYYRLLKVIYYFFYLIFLIIGIVIFPIIIIIFELLRNTFFYILIGDSNFKFNSVIWKKIIIFFNIIKSFIKKYNSKKGDIIFGIRRVKYFIYFSLLLTIFFSIIIFSLNMYYNNNLLILIGFFSLIFLIIYSNINYERLHNMGKSGWNIIGLLFPIAQIVVLFQLFFYKEKEGNNNLNKENKYIIITAFILICLSILGFYIYSFIKLNNTVNDLKIKQLDNEIIFTGSSIKDNIGKSLLEKEDGNIYLFENGIKIDFLTSKATLKNNCDNLRFFDDNIIKELGGIKDNSDYYSFVDYEIIINNGEYGIVKKYNYYCEVTRDSLYLIKLNGDENKLIELDVKGELTGSKIGEINLIGNILEVELYWASGKIKKEVNLNLY